MKPNILLIVLDAVRFDHLSCYGAERPTSPSLDALAEQGVLFENAFAAGSWTPPSHAALFTGKYPSQCGTMGHQLRLNNSHLTIAEFLRRQGYRTAGIGSAWISRRQGFAYGFEHFVELWQRTDWRDLAFTRDRLLRKIYDRVTHSNDGGDYAAVQWMKRWIKRVKGQGPFFGFLRFLSAHTPYAPPPPFKKRFEPELGPQDDLKKLRFLAADGGYSYMAGYLEVSPREWDIIRAWYDACILYIDSLIGSLITWLEDLELLDSTLIIVTSDHGENFGEHGLAGHSYCVYDTLLHVPLIIAAPQGLMPRGQRISDLISLVDILPTVGHIIGASDAIPPDVAGQSFFPLDSQPRRDAIFAEYGPPYAFTVFKRLHPEFSPTRFDRALRTIRTQTHKYIMGSDGQEELYDLTADPAEERNLIDVHPDLANQLRDRLIATLGGFETLSPTDTPSPLSAEEEVRLMAHLRDLGYL